MGDGTFKVRDYAGGVRVVNDFGSFVVGAMEVEYQGFPFRHFLIHKRLEPPVPLRIQSACTTGTVAGDHACECRHQLVAAMEYLERNDNGLIVWTQEHEGRGRGLVSKLHVYVMRQERGMSAQEACHELGVPLELRDFGQMPHVLRYLGVESVILLSCNREKARALLLGGIEVRSTIDL